MSAPLVLPRPGTSSPPRTAIPGPSESSFTATFGALLPAAEYIQTDLGRAAYYVFPRNTSPQPSSSQTSPPTSPAKVLLIHGVQTPALGLLPLTTSLRTRFPDTQFAALDLWGHGLSSTPLSPHTGSLFHAEIDAVLTALDWKTTPVSIVGYSFGAVLAMGCVTALQATNAIESLVLIAPAGLLRREWFTPAQLTLLSTNCSAELEAQAAQFAIETLEGGPLSVPEGWRERVERGEVVAQAIKAWQMEKHAGHAASVVGVFRDGGLFDNDELFVRARATGIPSLVVLGEKDGLSTEEEIADFGFDVNVVPGAGHAVVRENAEEVAEYIRRFWQGL
ncbi:alpha/beta-hydrolase [Didymella exigua CBS 183.55]|uniref:Alpha/beta-hydrolase n=1 Tax=Didymella exigua CBS 183.55 TaxID=1150837 RepID=A0A6A5RVK3_9PLEO|nr:alpha/beta-hydrolase [Didymella exigua CBS 183.55]KAF1932505.1 alpha/beta-hydrolase [Didymella exigua CBS 183.55]